MNRVPALRQDVTLHAVRSLIKATHFIRSLISNFQTNQ